MTGYSLRVTFGDNEEPSVLTDASGDGQNIVYTMPISAHRLNSEVKLELVCNGEVLECETWTMYGYCAALKESYSDDTQLLTLVDALYAYSTYIAYYADTETEAPFIDAVESLDAAELCEYVHTVTKPNGIGLHPCAALYLDDACALRFKFDAAAWEGCTLYVGGVAVEVTEVGSQVVYEIANLIPQDWGTAYNVQVTDSEGTVVLNMDYSVMSYAYARLTQAAEAQPGLNGLLKAMYLYHKAAKAYAA